MLLNLSDGRMLIELQLQAEPLLTDLTVFEGDDRYLVLSHNSQPVSPSSPPRPTLPLPGVLPKPVLQGRLYAIDKSGKLLWPEPVEIREQQLLGNQPPGLPVLMFACQTYENKQKSPGRSQCSMLAIDKRSGRIVYNNVFSNLSGIFNIVGNAEKKTIDIIMQRRTITLTFTDKPPLPPNNDAEKKKAEQPQEKTFRALLQSLEKGVEQLLGPPRKGEGESEEEEPPG